MARGPKNKIELCDLTDWHIPVHSGRGRKAEGKQKFTVEIAEWNWSLNIVREGYEPIGIKFASSLKMFLANIKYHTGVNIWEAIQAINEALANLTGRAMEINESASIESVASEMDKFYKCNLLLDDLDPAIAGVLYPKKVLAVD
jgi:hypothetical protein